jgi:hypothetical protein
LEIVPDIVPDLAVGKLTERGFNNLGASFLPSAFSSHDRQARTVP